MLNVIVKLVGVTSRVAMNVSTKATKIVANEVRGAYQESLVQVEKSKDSYFSLRDELVKNYDAAVEELEEIDLGI